MLYVSEPKEMKTDKVMDIVSYIMRKGHYRSSRLGDVYEVAGLSMIFSANQIMYRPGMSIRLGFVEALQILSASYDERQLMEAAPNLKEPFGLVHAYGLRIGNQLPKLIEQLQEDPESRRAMLHIGSPEDSGEQEKPCIQSYQFFVRDDILSCIISSRSSDIILGLTYDLLAAQVMTNVLASILGYKPGFVQFHTGSAHVYVDRLNELAAKYGDDLMRDSTIPLEFELTEPFCCLEHARCWALDQLQDISNWVLAPEGITLTSPQIEELDVITEQVNKVVDYLDGFNQIWIYTFED